MTSTRTPLSSAAQARVELSRDWRRAKRTLAAVLVVLWTVLLVDLLVPGLRLAAFGVVPRTITGLRGILFMPFLHGGVAHLLMNSLGLVTLGGLVLAREERYFWAVTAIGALVAGVGTWAIGSSGHHIGYSGVVFAYLGYLLFAGMFERRIGSVLLSGFVGLVWGGSLLGVLPGQPGISWEGHLFGFIGGALAARVLARKG